MSSVSNNDNKSLHIPDGFQEMLEELARLVISQQPTDVDKFSLQFFTERIKSKCCCPTVLSSPIQTVFSQQKANSVSPFTVTATSEASKSSINKMQDFEAETATVRDSGCACIGTACPSCSSVQRVISKAPPAKKQKSTAIATVTASKSSAASPPRKVSSLAAVVAAKKSSRQVMVASSSSERKNSSTSTSSARVSSSKKRMETALHTDRVSSASTKKSSKVGIKKMASAKSSKSDSKTPSINPMRGKLSSVHMSAATSLGEMPLASMASVYKHPKPETPSTKEETTTKPSSLELSAKQSSRLVVETILKNVSSTAATCSNKNIEMGSKTLASGSNYNAVAVKSSNKVSAPVSIKSLASVSFNKAAVTSSEVQSAPSVARSVKSTIQPTTEAIESIPEPAAEYVESTPGPAAEPVESAPEPDAEAVESAPKPAEKPVESAPELAAEPDAV